MHICVDMVYTHTSTRCAHTRIQMPTGTEHTGMEHIRALHTHTHIQSCNGQAAKPGKTPFPAVPQPCCYLNLSPEQSQSRKFTKVGICKSNCLKKAYKKMEISLKYPSVTQLATQLFLSSFILSSLKIKTAAIKSKLGSLGRKRCEALSVPGRQPVC